MQKPRNNFASAYAIASVTLFASIAAGSDLRLPVLVIGIIGGGLYLLMKRVESRAPAPDDEDDEDDEDDGDDATEADK